MIWSNLIFCIFLYFFHNLPAVLSLSKYTVLTLESNTTIEHTPELFPTTLNIYCFIPKPRNALHTWKSVYFHISVDKDEYTQYEGPSVEAVWDAYKNDNSFWSFNMLWNNQPNCRNIDPFEKICLALKTRQKYTLRLEDIDVDDKRVILMVIGMIIFMYSKTLGENALFFYLVGISSGICASFMILVYFISKLLPGKPIVYGTMIGGWTVGIYLLQWFWNNFKPLMITYHEYFIWYSLITGFISFIICYKMGPPQNQRSKNLITWSLQLIGIILMYFSTYLWESVIFITIILLLFKYITFRWIFNIFNLSILKKTPVRVLLTEDEYREQASIETAKALEELRGYCSSPECPSWKIIRKLKDPKRFADFIDGEDHLSDGEISEHEAMLEYTVKRRSITRTKNNGRVLKNPDFTSDDSSSSDDD